MASRAIRNNNPGNLKPPNEAAGSRWWGQHGFVGLDKDGFAIFDTPAGGKGALKQQVRSDQQRDQTQEEFIDKYVGVKADPQGTANAQINIPQVTGASADTSLTDIDTDLLVRAITQSEGGIDSVNHFFEIDRQQRTERLPPPWTPAPPLADPTQPDSSDQLETLLIEDRAKQERASTETAAPFVGPLQEQTPFVGPLQEQTPFVGPLQEPSGDEEELAWSEGTTTPLPLDPRIRAATRATAKIAPDHTITLGGDAGGAGVRTGGAQRLDLGITALLGTEERAAIGEGVSAKDRDVASRAVLEQDVLNERGDTGRPTVSYPPIDPWGTLEKAPGSAFTTGPGLERQKRVEQQPIVQGMPSGRIGDTGVFDEAQTEQVLLGKGGTPQQVQKAMRTGLMPSGEPTVRSEKEKAAREAGEEARALSPAPLRVAGMKAPPMEAVDQPALPESDVSVSSSRSLLDRLGKMISPEVAAQIAQAAGGLMSGVAGGRAQRKAGRETEQRVSRANLISAMTGGRVRPQVTAAEVDEGGLLSRLGQITTAGGRIQITTAGGKIATGEMARRRAEDIEERELGLKGRQVGTMERRIEVMQDKVTKEHEVDLKAAELALEELTGASYGRVSDGIEQLNKATNIYKGGGYLDPTQGHKNLYGQMRVLWADYEDDATPANVGAIFQVIARIGRYVPAVAGPSRAPSRRGWVSIL